MTNDPTYNPEVPFNAGSASDLFYGGAASVNTEPPSRRNEFLYKRRIKGTNVIESAIIIRDVRGDHVTEGTFPEASYGMRMEPLLGGGSTAISPADCRLPGRMILPLASNSDTSPVPTGTFTGLHSIQIFDKLLVGIGSGTDVSLARANQGGVTAITYNPTNTSSITSLSKAVIGGAATAERLIVGLSGDPAQIVSAIPADVATVDATMHTDLTALWGFLQTSIPDPNSAGAFRHLAYATTSLYNSLTTASATGDNPTATLTSLPQGGFILGESQLGGGPNSAWFVLPKQSTAGHMLQPGSEVPGFVYRVNLEGTDYNLLDFNEMPGGIFTAVLMRGGIIATNGHEVIYHTGDRELNLGLFKDRATLSGKDYRCRGLGKMGSRLIALVEWGGNYGWLEEYNWGLNIWQPIGAVQTGSTTPITAVGPIPAYEKPNQYLTDFSSVTWALYGASFKWFSQEQTQKGVDQLWGLLGGFPAAVDSPGYFLSAEMWLQGLEGMPTVLEEIRYLGQLDAASAAGGTVEIRVAAERAATLDIENAYLGVTFAGDDWVQNNVRRFPDNTDAFQRFQYRVTLTSANTSTKTPNGLPLIFRFLSFPDGVVQSPLAVRGY